MFMAAAAFGLSSSAAFAQASGAKGEDFLYRVMQGDTLGDLATRFTSGPSNWTTLQTLNNVQDDTRMPIGLLLRIPFPLIPELPARAEVSHVAGRVSVDGEPLKVSASVAEGQTVRTQADGFATLRLADGSVLSVPASSSLIMKRLRVFKGTGLTDSIIEMQSGSLESEVAPEKNGVGRFEVQTPVSVTGVRGTRLRVHVSPQEGSRSEVLQGRAGVDATHSPEAVLRDRQGVAVDVRGESSGVRDLLPAPDLPVPVRGGSGWVMSFPAVAGAHGYLVRVASDPDGANLVSGKVFPDPDVQFAASGAGTYYVFVRALDSEGLGGVDARQSFQGAFVLQDSSGASVSSGFGHPILVANY